MKLRLPLCGRERQKSVETQKSVPKSYLVKFCDPEVAKISYCIDATKVRFERPHKPHSDSNGKDGEPTKAVSTSGIQQPNGRVNSYANIVNGVSSSMHGTLISSSPALVLDDSCLVDRDLSKHAMGKVKEFSSIPNIQTILSDEDFSGVKLTYLERIPFNAWSRETFVKIGNKWGEMLELEDNVDNSFRRKRLCIKTKHTVSILESFKVIVKGKVFMVRAKELFTWNPSFITHNEREYSSEDESVHVSNSKNVRSQFNLEESDDDNASDEEGIPETVFGVNTSSNTHINEERGRQQSEDPFEIYDVLEKQKIEQNREPSPSLSHPPGFTPEVTEKPDEYATIDDVTDGKVDKEPSVPFNVKVLNSSQDVPEVSHSEYTGQNTVNNGGSVLGVLEDIIKVGQAMGYTMEGCLGHKTKKEWIEASLGASGGILCIWEATIFKKDNVTISNNFIAIYETWLPNNSKILFIVVYAPQQTSSKRIMWDYISALLGRWNRDSIIMGDFNEVRSIDERRGSIFNPYSARRFDRFISNFGLVDVKLEGYAFTWSHPSASKMSKPDRFLISEGILSSFPSITAICLDRHLSDHRPIMLREVLLDFEPTPFRFYHSWFDIPGFDDMIKLAWQSFSHMDENRLIRFKKKLQDLKELDRGMISDASLLRRLELKRKLLNITEMETKDKFKELKLNGRLRILVGLKMLFLKHFETRFKEPDGHRFRLNFQFPKKLLQSQVKDLESHISRYEIRLAVWNCGDNKSPGPDGYTFEFFKKYWDFIGSDFSESVEFFFINRSFSRECNSSFVALILKDYLLDVLEGFGFGSTWCNWIRGTLSFAKASILVNGSPSKEFFFHRGLKQGDPLAPYLFILVMESLHLSFLRVVEAGLFKGIQLSGPLSISHLFNADDVMFIGEWSEGNLKGILNILNCFFLASGLQINIHKSQVLGVGVPRQVVEHAVVSIGYTIMQNQFRYLGVKVGGFMSRHKAWEDIIHKIRSRLSKWKVNTLSIGGRLTLLKFVLGATPIYSMSIFKVPRGVLKALEAMRNLFFIGSDHPDRKITWVAWEKVIRALYGANIDVHPSYISSNWCSIVREIQVLKGKGFEFWSHCKKRIGDGFDTRFWFDLWIGDSPLHIRFHRLLALELDKEISVADKMHFPLDHSFRRIARDGLERHQMTELQSMLDLVSLSQSRDRWFCDLTGDGEFWVKEVRNSINDIFLPSSVEPTRWVKHIPIKVNIFAWRAHRDCLPTRVNLIRRGISLESYIFLVCRSCEEDAQHLFFQCDLVQSIWRRICR
nr:RNA-directed DNA polymerase, eukaryota [Tanacetum cinerariifolium]